MLHKWLAQVISRRAREMSRGLSQILPIAVIVVGFVSTTSESTLAGDRQISVAGLIDSVILRHPREQARGACAGLAQPIGQLRCFAKLSMTKNKTHQGAEYV